MVTCPKCGQENPPVAKFCLACGESLPAQHGLAEERKVVTVLFADLVGFTARAERLDPEDVRAILTPYFARVREQIEACGGTVEKFIGDAVMAVFGAPLARGDDPERAVRAALAMCAAVHELNESDADLDLKVRIAVNTGEALVTLTASAAQGEGVVAGDVVNTASRLQNAAPVNGIIVGEETYRATRSVIRYEEAEPVVAKGKQEPVRVWRAVAASAAPGERAAGRAPMLGRSTGARGAPANLGRNRRGAAPAARNALRTGGYRQDAARERVLDDCGRERRACGEGEIASVRRGDSVRRVRDTGQAGGEDLRHGRGGRRLREARPGCCGAARRRSRARLRRTSRC